jgi:hypothetical protein
MMNIWNTNCDVVHFFLDIVALIIPRLRVVVLVLGVPRPTNTTGLAVGEFRG